MGKTTAAIAANIPTAVNDAIEDYRWNNRIPKRSDIVNEALVEWCRKRGLDIGESAPTDGTITE